MNKVSLKILDERLKFPEYFPTFQAGNAGCDLRACISKTLVIYPNEIVKISTGFALHLLDDGLVGILVPRSGMGVKGLVIAQSIGVIDSSYTGTLIMPLWNRSSDAITIMPMDRVAQLLIQRVEKPLFEVVEEFPDTLRGSNGFGASGNK